MLFFRFSERTFSLWGHIWDHLDDYINPLYHHGDHDVIEPSTDLRQLRWESTMTLNLTHILCLAI